MILKRIKALLGIVFLCAVSFVGLAQQREERTVDDFNKINLAIGGCVVYVTQGDKKVDIEGPTDIVSEIKTTVSKGELTISAKDFFTKNKKNKGFKIDGVTLHVSTPTVKGIKITGSGNIHLQGDIQADNLDILITGSGNIDGKASVKDHSLIRITGSGDITLDLKTSSIDAYVSGSGEITLNAKVKNKSGFHITGSGQITVKGEGNESEINISGSGSVIAENFVVDKSEARVTGSGNITVNVNEELTTHTTGSGKIKYKGSPETLTFKTGKKPEALSK